MLGASGFFTTILVEVGYQPALKARTVEHGKVELGVVGAQLDEQVEGLVEGAGRVGIRPVGLVDDDDRPQAETQSAHEHVACLRHGTFVGVDQQQHAVDHAEHALDLAAEVGVPRRIDDVDQVAAPLDGTVLTADRDAALALKRVAVHDALLDVSAIAKNVDGAEDGVDERRLAVIDMSDYCQVADLVDRRHGDRACLSGQCARRRRGRNSK